METNAPTGRPFWLGNTEREIFSKINWIDYGYFYDLDHKWYYIIPGPFRIKLPLELVKNNLDKAGYEFEYRRKLEDELLKYILDEYRCTYSDFNEFIKKEDIKFIWDFLKEKKVIVFKVFYLYFYEDMSIKDVAGLLKISESNVKHYLYRTLNELKVVMKNRGDENV